MTTQRVDVPLETIMETGLSGEPSIPLSALADVDRRICPSEHMLDWQSPALNSRELALINHVHGIVANHITGPEEVRIAIGIRTLGDIAEFDAATDEQITERKSSFADADAAKFALAMMRKQRLLGEELGDILSDLQFAGKLDQVVPAILRAHSVNFDYPEGVVGDLSALEIQRTASVLAVRKGLADYLNFELSLSLDGALTDRRLQGEEPEVSLTLAGSDDEIAVRLDGLHRSMGGDDLLEVSGDGWQRRIPNDLVRMLGITVTRSENDNLSSEAGADEPQPTQSRRRWFRKGE